MASGSVVGNIAANQTTTHIILSSPANGSLATNASQSEGFRILIAEQGNGGNDFAVTREFLQEVEGRHRAGNGKDFACGVRFCR
jgi:hypothetical protein